MKKNLLYESPKAELLMVRFEMNILSAGSANDGFDPNHDLGGLGDEDGD